MTVEGTCTYKVLLYSSGGFIDGEQLEASSFEIDGHNNLLFYASSTRGVNAQCIKVFCAGSWREVTKL